MRTLAAKEAKNSFGRLLDTARQEPVTIEKNGRAVAVILSLEEFERLQALEEEYWLARARAAEKGGFLGRKKSEKLLQDLLSAED
jgi:prevent-host-death family protein